MIFAFALVLHRSPFYSNFFADSLLLFEKPAKKPAAKKTPAKTTRATAPVETVKVQFGGDEYDFAEIIKAVEADYKSKLKGKVKTIEFYIKPEDKAVYYVINGDFSDKIEL